MATVDSLSGFVAALTLALGVPDTAVYADGLVVAGATHMIRLSPAEVSDLVATVDQAVAGRSGRIDTGDSACAADHPWTSLGVRSANGAFREVSGCLVYRGPVDLLGAKRRLLQLGRRTVEQGEPYTAGRVRLAFMPTDRPADRACPVPLTVSADPLERPQTQDFTGDQAQAVMTTLDQYGSHPTAPIICRTSQGTALYSQWRFLLPHE